MCTNNTGTMVPYGIKVPNPAAAAFTQFHAMSGMTQAAFEYHRAQLYDYATRFPYGIRGYPPGALTYHPHPQDPLAHAFLYKHDPRARFIHEEPKPSHSYIGLIAMAILSHKENKLVLSDIYQWILDNYAYFRARGPGWRNSIRHNLSLNDCFIKAGRSANGKGHYWAIHPANIEDFKKGDFRRRRAQRRVRKHMGLSVPDDEDSPSPPPSSTSPPWPNPIFNVNRNSSAESKDSNDSSDHSSASLSVVSLVSPPPPTAAAAPVPVLQQPPSRKRQFDVESLLAPDDVTITAVAPKHIRPTSPAPPPLISERVAKTDEDECDVVNLSNRDDLDQRDAISCDGHNSPDIQVSNSDRSFGSPRGSPVDCSVRRSPNSESEIPVAAAAAARSWQIPGLVWPRDGPSAFHSTAAPNTAIAWTTLSPHGYPIMTAPYPVHPAASSPSNISDIAAAQQWQATFSKIMAKSYEQQQKTSVKIEL
ncbi:uncharacterized protein LOC141905326 [Tubulanus polymorphus]|uniref:uncharacterized protein LOC141905326 n=1 Tax=Tubulanus polymorphus TaxID=672921 RepID=UPI003DA23511